MRLAALSILSIGILAGCTSPSGTADTAASSASTSSATSVAMAQTQNVSFRGTIAPAGISIYMEGTHRLELADGRFLLLESATVDLGSALGKSVEVEGAVRPTVEAGGVIMAVTRLTLMDGSSSSSSSSTEQSSSDASSLSMTSLSTSLAAMTSSTSSTPTTTSKALTTSAAAISSSLTSVASQVSSAKTSVVAAQTTSATAQISGRFSEEMLTRATAMGADDLSSARWTQQYCSSHVGFCIPIHKNWWFKSFGATSVALWQVEISNGPIDVPGTGPVVVKVLSGTVEGQKATDGLVRTEGDAVIGYRAWTENRHVEVIAPAGLDAVVRYITEGVKGV